MTTPALPHCNEKAPNTLRYRMTVAYDGSQYAGWQVQPAHVTVQQRLEERLLALTGDTVKVHGSGRTDQGVHAQGQVAHFDLSKAWDPGVLHKGLNALLPDDIRVIRMARTAPDFHARRSATKKEYRYFIWNAAVMDPCRRLYATHVRRPLDVKAMQAAAHELVGCHDFAAFTANPNRVVESTVRTIEYIRIRKAGHVITVAAASEGFLYKMVRSICGLLIRAGEGAVAVPDVRAILASRVRTARVPTAPAEGLFLWRVWY
jgi:tRNA pseudouridine38-40 synthase